MHRETGSTGNATCWENSREEGGNRQILHDYSLYSSLAVGHQNMLIVFFLSSHMRDCVCELLSDDYMYMWD